MDSVTADISAANAITLKQKAAALFELTKARIAVMLLLTAAAGYYLGTAGKFDWVLFLNSMLGILLLAFGVGTLNQVIERRTDALMERTRNRPLPSNRVTLAEALIFGVLLCLGAEMILFLLVNTLTGILGLTVIAGYVLLYTPLKTRTTASTAIGAIPGAMPPLMGWTAASGEISLSAWALFVLLFLWQFPHFLAIAWMYRDQYAKAGILMLPVVEPRGSITAHQIVLFAMMMVTVSIAPYFLHLAGMPFLIGASLLGVWFFSECIFAAKALSNERARRLLLVSVIYLPLIFAILVFDKQ